MRTLRTFASLSMILVTTGCTAPATVTNVREQPCQQHFASALADILVEEGEQPEQAKKVLDNAASPGTTFDNGPRPFTVSSQSGADYSFFVEKKGEQCLLRLYGRQKGFTRYTNNLSYIRSKELPGCQCTD